MTLAALNIKYWADINIMAAAYNAANKFGVKEEIIKYE